MKSKWYIKERSYFLKDIEYFYRSNGHFSKKNEYAVGFDSEADAQTYLDNMIARLETESNFEASLKKFHETVDLWTCGNLSHKEACAALAIEYYPKQLDWCQLHYHDYGSGLTRPYTKEELLEYIDSFVDIREAEHKGVILARIRKAKVVSEELKIEFIKNHQNDIRWREEKEEVKGHNDKGYCQCCGVRVPGMKYLIIPSTHKSSRICAFCVGRLAEEVKPILNDIDDDLVKEYKQEHFMVKL